MDDHIDRALARAADGPDPDIDLDEVAAAARRRRRRQRGAAIAAVVVVLAAVPAAVIAWNGAGQDDTVMLTPDEDDADPAGKGADRGQPAAYTITVQASPAGEAPFAITGAQTTVAADRDGVPVQLTLTSPQHLLLQDVRWTYVNDQRDPDLAVAGPHCALNDRSDRTTIGCALVGRALVIRSGEPLREKLAVCLPGTDPVGTYDYTQPIKWWRIDADTRGPEISKVDDQPADGRVDVTVRVRVQPASQTPQSTGAEPDDEGGRCNPPGSPMPTPTPTQSPDGDD